MSKYPEFPLHSRTILPNPVKHLCHSRTIDQPRFCTSQSPFQILPPLSPDISPDVWLTMFTNWTASSPSWKTLKRRQLRSSRPFPLYSLYCYISVGVSRQDRACFRFLLSVVPTVHPLASGRLVDQRGFHAASSATTSRASARSNTPQSYPALVPRTYSPREKYNARKS